MEDHTLVVEESDVSTPAEEGSQLDASNISPFTVLARATRKDLGVIERHAEKMFSQLVRKGYRSGDILTAISLIYHVVLTHGEKGREGFAVGTHEYMKDVFDEMANSARAVGRDM